MSIFSVSDSILTPSAGIKVFPTASVDQIWHRLIPSRFPPVQVYARIIGPDRHDEVSELEALTSPRVRARERLIGIGAVDTTSPKLQNWNHAPFTYLNPEGSYLFRPGIGVLEVYDQLQTALAVSVKRRERFLRSTAMPKLGLDMRVLTTKIGGEFVDLRREQVPADGRQRWRLGDELVAAKVDGALFACPERPHATALAVINGDRLPRSIQADHFRFVWDGHQITSLYSFSGEGTVIEPQRLSGPDLPRLR